MGWFRRRKARYIRANYQDLPQEEWTDDEYDHWFMHLPEEEAWQHWDHWSQHTTDPPESVRGIHLSVVQAAANAAKHSHPLEFACLLAKHDGIIDELVLIPTVQGDEHAIMDLWQAPHDRSCCGTLHSHPDTHPYPSDADFELFAYEGIVHLIFAMPYDSNFRAYDFKGQPIHLPIIDDETGRVVGRTNEVNDGGGSS